MGQLKSCGEIYARGRSTEYVRSETGAVWAESCLGSTRTVKLPVLMPLQATPPSVLSEPKRVRKEGQWWGFRRVVA
jgi:hypothetical protein